MRIFKQQYQSKSGKTKESKKWYLEFVDHNEIRRRVPGFTDKKATQELGRKLEQLVASRMTNQPLDLELTRWIESLGPKIRERLIKIGLVDAQIHASSKPLLQHLDEFHQSLLNKNRAIVHADVQKARIRNVINGCGFRFYGDIHAAKVEQFLADRRADKNDGICVQTSNYYLQAFKQFCNWMVKERRISESPVSHLSSLNANADRRKERRNLTPEELTRLLEQTAKGPRHHKLSGQDRAMLYRVAMETGFRRSELRTITPRCLKWDLKVPAISIEAGNTKNRRHTVQTVRPELLRELKQWIEEREIARETPLWGDLTDRTADMLRRDLIAAEIPYTDESGRVADFHSLRHSFISLLAKSGVHPKMAQKLARHSDINLTMNRYSHISMNDEAAALSSLPSLPSIMSHCQVNPGERGTAKFGSPSHSKSLPNFLPKQSAKKCSSMRVPADLADRKSSDREKHRAKENPCKTGVEASSEESEEVSTGGGTRTRTSVTSLDFESSASAIPPLRQRCNLLDTYSSVRDRDFLTNYYVF